MASRTLGAMDKIGRKPERAKTDRVDLYRILDASHVGVLSTIKDGKPWSIPTLYARVDDRIVLHGSTGAGALRHVAAGADATFCVFVMDAIVVADNLFNSSANYRSAVVRGRLQKLTEAEALDGLTRMSDGLIPGRSMEVVATSTKELAATLAIALSIEDDNWTAKERSGGPGEPDVDPDAWTGIVPMTTAYGDPVPSEYVPAGTPVPDSVIRLAAQT